MKRRIAWSAGGIALLLAATWSVERCGGDGSGGAASSRGELRALRDVPDSTPAARELAAALFEERRWDDTQRVLTAIVARRDTLPADEVALGQVAFARWVTRSEEEKRTDVIEGWATTARNHCRAGLARDPTNASAHYVLGVLAVNHAEGETPELAIAPLDRALELAPGDVATRVHLAHALEQSGEKERAIELYEGLYAQGAEYLGVHWRMVLYRLSQLLRRRGGADAERGRAIAEIHHALPDSTSDQRDREDSAFGSLGKFRITAPVSGDATMVAAARVRFGPPVIVSRGAFGKVHAFDVADLDGDLRDDVVWCDDRGIACASPAWDRRAPTRWIAEGGFEHVTAAELEWGDPHGNGRASVIAWGSDGVCLFSPHVDGGWRDDGSQLPSHEGDKSATTALLPLDFDHDGNLDLALVMGGTLELWRNLGIPRELGSDLKKGLIRFDSATEGAGVAGTRATWLLAEDFDGDHDVDLMAGGGGLPTQLFSNLRRGRFEPRAAAATGLPDDLCEAPLIGDLDGDSFVDVMAFGAPARLFRGDGALRFAAADAPAAIARPCGIGASFVDADLDGRPEWRDGAAATDFDLDGALDLASIEKVKESDKPDAQPVERVVVRRGEVEGAPRRALLVLRGRRDNRFARGAIVETRCGACYQRRWVNHPVQLFGFGGDDPPVVRITWPDGVTQHPLQEEKREDVDPIDDAAAAAVRFVNESTLQLDLSRDQRLLVTQKKGPPGSCPFLYAWNGTRFEFITDVLGATPLGLPIDETRFVQPDHDELVRLAPSQLAPVDGEYRFQLTEELRETTYLDRAQLWVVDHPAGIEVQPEERFCFPPFPPTTLHALSRLEPLRARDQNGRDWSAELAARDDLPAIPFTPRNERTRGLATLHSLELALPAAARDAARIRLVMTGWLQWGDASINLAIARSGSLEFLPPLLAVPDGAGGWRDCGPPVGFPAGKTKTMVLDVTALVDRADLRLRMTSTLELYWDQIAVQLDATEEAGDPPLAVTKVEPKSARLWHRGFSKPLPRKSWQAERYDWDQLDPIARWDQHRGMLTRYGDVVPLLGAADDRYVLFSSGDAIDLRFDATTLPPLADGMARTCLLFLDGWAKDGDANTVHSQTVGPLPFHAMSGYPYESDEAFPADEAHEAWQREWNTRPGRKLLIELHEPKESASHW